jgi:hypothetical protein
MTTTKTLLRALAALGLLALLSTAAAPEARAGEDFPFFCAIQSTPMAFRVVSDHASPTGYSMILYRRLRLDQRIPAELGTTADGKYWVVKGSHLDTSRLYRREVLAYIGMADERASHGDIKAQTRTGRARGWDLKPMTCQSR